MQHNNLLGYYNSLEVKCPKPVLAAAENNGN